MTYDEAQTAFRLALETGEGEEEAIEALCLAQAPVFRAKLVERAADAARKRITRPLQAQAERLCGDLTAWAAAQDKGEARAAALSLVGDLGKRIRGGGTAEQVTEWAADLARRAELVTGGVVK